MLWLTCRLLVGRPQCLRKSAAEKALFSGRDPAAFINMIRQKIFGCFCGPLGGTTRLLKYLLVGTVRCDESLCIAAHLESPPRGFTAAVSDWQVTISLGLELRKCDCCHLDVFVMLQSWDMRWVISRV